MHILIAIVGIIAAAAFWWYRIQYMGKAAGEVADAIGNVRGSLRRNAMRKKSAISPITAIDDPVVAAATVILAIAAEDALISDELEERLRLEVATIAASDRQVDEAVVYAKWATNQVADVPIVIDKAATLLKDTLSEHEKEQLIGMVQTVTSRNERHHMFDRRIELLRRKLGLVVRD